MLQNQEKAASRPPRFHVPAPLPAVAGEAVDLDAEESRHAAKALRLAEGDAVELCDGGGGLLLGRIASLGKKAVTVEAAAPPRQVHNCCRLLAAPLSDSQMNDTAPRGAHRLVNVFWKC